MNGSGNARRSGLRRLTTNIVAGSLVVLAAMGASVPSAGVRKRIDRPPSSHQSPPNAYDDFLAAARATVDDSDVYYATAPKRPSGARRRRPFSRREMDELLKKNELALKRLHLGLTHPYTNPLLGNVLGHGEEALWAEGRDLETGRRLARLLKLESMVEAAHGNWGGAIESRLDAIRLCETMMTGGTLIGMEVAVSAEAFARSGVWPLIDHLTASQAMKAGRRLEEIDCRHSSFAVIVREEQYVNSHTSISPSAAEIHSLSAGKQGGSPTLLERVEGGLAWIVGRRLQQPYDAYLDRSIEYVRSHAYSPDSLMEKDPNSPLSKIMAPMLNQQWLRERVNYTEDLLLATSLALRAYRSAHGRYPTTLNDLVPEELRSVPDDPFAPGAALLYRRNGGAYVLYSVGPDGHDDGGRPIVDPRPSSERGSSRRVAVTAHSRGDLLSGIDYN